MPTVGPDLPPLSPTHEEFHALASQGNLIPIFTELSADLDTPLSPWYVAGAARRSRRVRASWRTPTPAPVAR